MNMSSNMRSCLKLKPKSSSAIFSRTPERKPPAKEDYSPVFVPCTQESLDSVDVLWDWNSPTTNSTSRQTRKPKRLITTHKYSPQPCIKKSSSHPIPDSFDKLRDDLRALQEEFVQGPSLPLQFDDVVFATNNNNNDKKPLICEDLFNDSMEDELLFASQQLEYELGQQEKKPPERSPLLTPAVSTPNGKKIIKSTPRTLVKSFSSNALFDSPSRTATAAGNDLFMNDSLDNMLKQLDEHVIGVIAKRDERKCPSRVANSRLESSNGNLKFKVKSLSFDTETTHKSADELLREDIERKRQAALAKLRARKQASQALSDSETSPIKCSPEEIELKRQQAVAKLQMKRKQELIERNRHEALKRLETNRQKRAH